MTKYINGQDNLIKKDENKKAGQWLQLKKNAEQNFSS